MNKLKYPYGAKSALFITSDDLNPALIFNQKYLIYNPDQALLNLKKAAKLSQKYHFPISYGFIPNYTYKENNQFKIINFLDNKYLKWREELKKQIKKGLCFIFAHGKYHLPNFMTPNGNYENKEDWKYIKEIILKEFKIETKTFRSPGYQWKKSQNWNYQDYILNLRASGFEIILDAAYSFYKPNDFGYTQNLAIVEENKLINLFKKIDIINLRKILSNKLKFLLKKNLSQKENIQDKEELFYIGTYRDLDFNKGEYGNALERVELSYQKGDFIQESILYTYFHKNKYWEILDKIAHFANQAGINKSCGIWMPKNAEEVKKWHESRF